MTLHARRKGMRSMGLMQSSTDHQQHKAQLFKPSMVLVAAQHAPGTTDTPAHLLANRCLGPTHAHSSRCHGTYTELRLRMNTASIQQSCAM